MDVLKSVMLAFTGIAFFKTPHVTLRLGRCLATTLNKKGGLVCTNVGWFLLERGTNTSQLYSHLLSGSQNIQRIDFSIWYSYQ
jgi:hypothetical protein